MSLWIEKQDEWILKQTTRKRGGIPTFISPSQKTRFFKSLNHNNLSKSSWERWTSVTSTAGSSNASCWFILILLIRSGSFKSKSMPPIGSSIASRHSVEGNLVEWRDDWEENDWARCGLEGKRKHYCWEHAAHRSCFFLAYGAGWYYKQPAPGDERKEGKRRELLLGNGRWRPEILPTL